MTTEPDAIATILRKHFPGVGDFTIRSTAKELSALAAAPQPPADGGASDPFEHVAKIADEHGWTVTAGCVRKLREDANGRS